MPDKQILVIDDDPVIVKYLTSLFEDNGYKTVAAANGNEALAALKRSKPDLITLDLDMPENYGTKFYRQIRKDEQFGDIPIIVISGVPRAEMSIKKAVAIVIKPFDREELLKLVRDTIGEAEA
ncbi:MAG: DVU0259 family response regulator domain-containing protein [Thermodesulfobacteriota bacterium]